MPRDKTESHVRVKKAIRDEFLKKGYKGASIRSIGEKAGMTSAGLYRHYSNKEAMFGAIVEPLINDMNSWMENHKNKKYDLISQDNHNKELFGESISDFVIEVIIPHKEEFLMLTECSKGTKYENFLHDFILANQGDLIEAFEELRKHGYPVKDIDEEKLHMLISAHITACLEPVIHNYDDDKIKECMETVRDFFMPGWMNLMGF
ncbi:MAG: TetR/AcrR family transcriptional regulator [Lachnospiraceae bacterium]|nr:TetR/AcrR family transcriptional regulator [Lachnospiraceae bacterium]